MSRLVIVSNRVPSSSGRRPGSAEGGLAVALLSALRERGGVWFGWSGEITEHESPEPSIAEVGDITYATVDLNQRDYDEYYYGFANQSLWPLFHYRPILTQFHRRFVAGYDRVNSYFANRLLPLLQPDDTVWVQDYHFIPFATRLRQAGCRNRMGFFLHIPWPPLQIMLALPNHRELVRHVCQYDLVGFQLEEHREAFADYILNEAGGTLEEEGYMTAFGRRFRVGAYPISIDTGEVARTAARQAASLLSIRLADSLGDKALIIGADRLDYSKGLPQRMHAYEYLLENYPENRGTVTYLQITPSSRADVPEYAQIGSELEAAAGHVNAKYAEFDWVPTRYINRGYDRSTLTGFFRLSDVGLVTPLRDGMNLVAKEYVAAQPEDNPGVLVLSRFAGAAHELEEALIVNPFDIDGIGETLQRALNMPLAERRDRWRPMFERLKRDDIGKWRRKFLADLA